MHHDQVIHHDTAMRADVYLPGDDALTAWAFEHRMSQRIGDYDLALAPTEAVILSKLRYYQTGGRSVTCATCT